jgi:ribonuclease P protein component
MVQCFGKDQRVVKSDQFARIIKRGSCAADGTLVLFAAAASDPSRTRLGITIPKRTGNAVHRNRWKRLIRESFRTQQPSLPRGYDFVVRPKKGAEPCWPAIQKSLPRLAAKAIARMK